MKGSRETAIVRRRYDRIAAIYDLIEGPMERMLAREWRRELWKEARGKILEVGVGTGKNMEFYPERGRNVTAIDISPKMLARAKRRAEIQQCEAKILCADVQNLPFPDNSFDTIISTFVFCSVPDPERGLREIARVCRPGGQALFIEHVRSEKPFVGLLMDLLNPLTRHLMGFNINRRTVQTMERVLGRVEVINLRSNDIFKKIRFTSGNQPCCSGTPK